MADLQSICIDGNCSDVPQGGATYSAGTGITIDSNNAINADRNPSNTYSKTEVDALLAGKQGSLTPGDNISISNGVISATDTKYSAGTALELSGTTFNVQLANNNTQATAGQKALDAVQANPNVADTFAADVKRLSRAIPLSGSPDFNTITTRGEYGFSAAIAQAASNCPVTVGGRLTVERTGAQVNDTYVRQICRAHNNLMIWERYTTNGGTSWTDWTDVSAWDAYRLRGKTLLPSEITNINTLITPGEYYVAQATAIQGVSGFPWDANEGHLCRLRVELVGQLARNVRQTVFDAGGNNIWVRNTTNSGSTWTAWRDLTQDNDTTYGNATDYSAGLMSAADKIKLDNLSEIRSDGSNVSRSVSNSWTDLGSIPGLTAGKWVVIGSATAANGQSGKSFTLRLSRGVVRQTVYFPGNDSYSGSLADIFDMSQNENVKLQAWAASSVTITQTILTAIRIG